MASVTIVMSGDDSRLQAAHERLFAQQQKALDNYAKAVAKSKESQAQAAADLESRKAAAEAEKARLATIEKGQKLIANQRDAQQKFNDAVKEAEELERAGAISSADLAKRKQVLAKELRDATGETARYQAAMQRGEAITKATMTATERHKAKLTELIALHRSGAIDVKTFSRAVDESKSELENVSGSVGKTAVSIGEAVAAYGALQLGAQVFNGLLQEQNQLQQAALDKTKAVASAQSDAVKNLAGMAMLEQKGLLTTTAEKIAKSTGFADRGEIIKALAASISAGGTVAESESAVTAAAAINKTTPEQLGSTAAGAVDLARATGIADAERNLSFLLNVGNVSRVESFDKLGNALAKTVGNVAATTPEVDKQTATREAAAMFAVLNRASNDRMGESTATASNQLGAYLRKFFTEGGGQTDMSEQIAKLESNKAITEKEAFAIKQAEEKVAKSTGKEKEKAEVQLNAIRANATLDPIEEKKLAELKRQQAIFDNLKKQDPGSLSGRMQVIQADPELRKAFLEKLPGEAAFKIPMEMLVTKGSEAFAEFKANFQKITFEETEFNKLKKQVATGTPQLAIADAGATATANIENFNLDPRTAAIAEIKKIRSETIPLIRSEGLFGGAQMFAEAISEPIASMGMATIEGAATDTRSKLLSRRRQLVEATQSNIFDGRTRNTDPSLLQNQQISLIDKQLAAIDQIVTRLNALSNAGDKMDKAADKINQAANVKSSPQSIAPNARAQADTAR